MITHFLKSAYRTFTRNKYTSIINVFGITLGLASILLIGNWVLYELSFDGFHEKKERIYRLIEKQSFEGQAEKYLSSMPEWLVETFEKDIPGIEASAALLNVGNLWFGEGDNRVEIKNVTFTNNKLFHIFTLDFIEGSPDKALTKPYNIVLTESLKKKLFNEPSVIGKKILYQNKDEYTITGVIRDIPDNSHFQAEMLVSIETRKPAWNMENYNHTTSIYLLLDEETSPDQIFDPLQQSKNRYMPHNAEYIEFQIQPMADIHLRSTHTIWGQNWRKSNMEIVQAFLLIGILVFVISTINYINLSTATALTRFKEAGLKKVIGSSKLGLIFQILFESFAIIFISYWLSLLVVELLKPLLIRYGLFDIGFNLYEYKLFFPVSIIMIFCISLIAGIYPAIIISTVQPIQLFKRNINFGKGSIPIRRILIISQLGITCILTIGVLFISRQILYMQQKDLGYSKDAVVYFNTGFVYRQNYKTIKEELLKYDCIENITSSNIPLGTSMWRNCIHFEGENDKDLWITPYMMTDYNFFDFYQIELIEGRGFSEEFALDKNKKAFLINESLARKIGMKDIVGKKFRTCEAPWGEVVGVIKDFNYRSLHHTIEPLAVQLGIDDRNVVSVKLKAAKIDEALKLLEETWQMNQPEQPFSYMFLDENLETMYRSEKRTIKIVSTFSVLSILVSSIGLLGLIQFIAASKTKEIGIRKVNGASVKNIITLLSSDLIINAVVAIIIAIPIGWYAIIRWRDSFAYKAGISWWIFLLSGLIIILLVFLAISYHTFKAARKNPVEVLRYE